MNVKKKEICSSLLRNSLIRYRDYKPIIKPKIYESARFQQVVTSRTQRPLRSSSTFTQRHMDSVVSTMDQGIQNDFSDHLSSDLTSTNRTPIYSREKQNKLIDYRWSSFKNDFDEDPNFLCTDTIKVDEYKNEQKSKEPSRTLNSRIKRNKSSNWKPRSSSCIASKAQYKHIRGQLELKGQKKAKTKAKRNKSSQQDAKPMASKFLERRQLSKTMPQKIRIFDYTEIYNVINGNIKIIKNKLSY
ncbi:unnamed protein product [Blepharisma stoltei]|uniref:Uncharacterized protein n=1 Tax=Blepharisma stoltei TaxID=1481888 RepID=A0AAU9JVI6_9CILI|nr:unnamed protein product [Blepharisma stoltei]